MTRRGAWLASVAVAAGLTGWAAARPETSTPFDAKKFAGDQLARMAIGRLRAVPEPGIADYRIAALTLRMVRPLVGEDLELLRLELEAWSGAGDTARFDETLREVVKADPSDTVAQLRLIVSRIRELQNSDDRLNAYLKILGSKGKALHATVRSQLALDAALLARENGNQAAFIELMTQAAQLDPTNKDAVSLFVTYFIDRTTDPLEKVKLLTDVVAADPTDHSATMNLTHALMSCGAWKAAARTLPLSNMAYAATGGRPDAQRFIDGMIITWRAEGAAKALEPITNAYNAEQTNINMEFRKAQREGHVLPGEQPDVALLVPALENTRLMIAAATGDAAMTETSLKLLLMQYALMLGEFAPDKPLPEGVTREQATQTAATWILESLMARINAGMDYEGAEKAYAEITSPQFPVPVSADAALRFRALLDWRECDFRSLPVLEYLADRGDLSARLALGIAAEEAGRLDDAACEYAILSLNEPMSVMGAIAATRAERMGRPAPAQDRAPEINKYIASWAPWLEGVVSDPYKYMALRTTITRPMVGLFDRAEAVVSIQNVSRRPLALGPTSIINSRFLITPDLSVTGRQAVEMAAPEVLELRRRLRLEPGETVSAKCWLSLGSVGSIFLMYPADSVSARWRTIQGFLIAPAGGFKPGPMCVTADSEVMQRRAIMDAPDLRTLMEELRTATGPRMMECVTLMCREARRRKKDEPEAALAERLNAYAGAVAERMKTMTGEEKAGAMIIMWYAGIFGTDAGKLLALSAQDDQSLAARLAVLHCAAMTPTDPRLDEAKGLGDPLLAEFVVALRESLATAGPYRHPRPEPEE